MCTLFLLFNKIHNYPIAIISNRDEMHNRPSSPLQGWNKNLNANGEEIYAPRDDTHGGTWFGFLNKDDFKYAFLTNIRNPDHKETSKTSRGKIIPLFLNFNLSPHFFIAELKKISQEYNFFNLIFGNKDECLYFHSKTGESKLLWNKSQKKEKIFGLSNGKLDSNWPKVQETKKILRQTIQKYDWFLLKQLMRNEKKYPLTDLPHTGVTTELEVFLSSLFIQHEKYGTRSTTFFCLSPITKSAQIFESNYNNLGMETEEREYQLAVR